MVKQTTFSFSTLSTYRIHLLIYNRNKKALSGFDEAAFIPSVFLLWLSS